VRCGHDLRFWPRLVPSRMLNETKGTPAAAKETGTRMGQPRGQRSVRAAPSAFRGAEISCFIVTISVPARSTRKSFCRQRPSVWGYPAHAPKEYRVESATRAEADMLVKHNAKSTWNQGDDSRMNATAKPQDRVRGQMDIPLSPQGRSRERPPRTAHRCKGWDRFHRGLADDSGAADRSRRAQAQSAGKVSRFGAAGTPLEPGCRHRATDQSGPADHPAGPPTIQRPQSQEASPSIRWTPQRPVRPQQLHSLKPGERRLVLAHHSQMRYLHGWEKKGFRPT